MTPRVILIGGTSHVGKSTLAAGLSSDLQWDQMSTDQLARHPGRPWGESVKAHVIDYYLSRSTETLVDEVVDHYQKNVAPIVTAIVQARLGNPFDHALVFEGSAILPDMMAELEGQPVKSLWLTLPDDLVRQRIIKESGFAGASQQGREVISRFTDRSIGFNQWLQAEITRTGQRMLDGSDMGAMAELKASLVALAAQE